METELGIIIDARSWDAIYSAACDAAVEAGVFITIDPAATEAGLQNICIWPTYSIDKHIVLIRGEA